MIIVEGPDNSGKSTLIKSLIKDFNLLLAEKPHGPPQNVNDLIYRSSKLLLKQDQKRYIVDRHPLISEKVYGPALRNKDLWEEKKLTYCSFMDILNDSSLAGSVFIIYCRPPNEVVLNLSTHEVKGYDTAEHLEALKSNLQKVVEGYDNIMSLWADFKYNYKDSNSYELLTKKLKEEYFHERE